MKTEPNLPSPSLLILETNKVFPFDSFAPKQDNQFVSASFLKYTQNYSSPSKIILAKQKKVKKDLSDKSMTKTPVEIKTINKVSELLPQFSGIKFKENKDRSASPLKNRTPKKRNLLSSIQKKSPALFNCPKQINNINNTPMPKDKYQISNKQQLNKILTHRSQDMGKKNQSLSQTFGNKKPDLSPRQQTNIKPRLSELKYTKLPQTFQSNISHFQQESFNVTLIIRDFEQRLNQKQVMISELQSKLSLCLDQMNIFVAEHTRQIKEKEKQSTQLIQSKNILQKSVKELSFDNFQLRNKLKQQQNQSQTLRNSQNKLNQELIQTKKLNLSLQCALKQLNNNHISQNGRTQLTQIRKQLNEKQQRIFQVESYNQNLLFEMDIVKQTIRKLSLLVYTLSSKNGSSKFQHSFKNPLDSIYKSNPGTSQKNNQIESIKCVFQEIMQQNQKLRKKLMIEDLRSETEHNISGHKKYGAAYVNESQKIQIQEFMKQLLKTQNFQMQNLQKQENSHDLKHHEKA